MSRVVVPMRGARPPFLPKLRQCSECGEETSEAGERCEMCRTIQGPVSASYIQSTAADAVRQLEKLKPSDAPEHMRGPLGRALGEIRRVYDACEPLIHSFHIGVVQVEENEFWAFPYPYDTQPRLGPFGKRRHAERALVEHALEHGAWDTGDDL